MALIIFLVLVMNLLIVVASVMFTAGYAKLPGRFLVE